MGEEDGDGDGTGRRRRGARGIRRAILLLCHQDREGCGPPLGDTDGLDPLLGRAVGRDPPPCRATSLGLQPDARCRCSANAPLLWMSSSGEVMRRCWGSDAVGRRGGGGGEAMWRGGEGAAACLKASWAAARLKTDPRDGVENRGRGGTAWTVDGRLSGGTGHSSQSEA
jgi:hypothetical protein